MVKFRISQLVVFLSIALFIDVPPALTVAIVQGQVLAESLGRAARAKPEDPTSLFDLRADGGVSLHELGARSKDKSTPTNEEYHCGYLMGKVVHTLKYHVAKKYQNHAFLTEPEARLYANLADNDQGMELLMNTMRVLGNYTLADGIQAGELWTIDNMNNYISCELKRWDPLEEHEKNEHGDKLYQGDMAGSNSVCHYSEHNSKTSNITFLPGTQNCFGVHGCQFEHPDEAVHFCNNEPECTLIMGRLDENNCEGGFGCYQPLKGVPQDDDGNWSASGGKTFVKHCPGVLLQTDRATGQGRSREGGHRWQSGVVNYCFASDVIELGQEAFTIAAESVQRQVPCLELNLVPRINDTHCSTIPSIMVQSKHSGCWSYVGQVSGNVRGWLHRSQPLNLAPWCSHAGVALHQLSHALGMTHENARADRDDYLEVNHSNILPGKELEFTVSQDVVMYAWDGYDVCPTRAGRTRFTMPQEDCAAINGYFSGGAGNGSLVECQLDLCEDGKYSTAPTNKCKKRVAQVAIKMHFRDCKSSAGTPSTSSGNWWDWTDCHFDLCTDGRIFAAKPMACGNKVAHGYIETPGNDCKNMKGTMAHGASADGGAWINCYLDFCRGVYDVPFDYLSLMMNSPYSWVKTTGDREMPTGMTMKPKGNRRLETVMGQRMGYSKLDVMKLGHMYDCLDDIHPDFDAENVSERVLTGEMFEYNDTCEDAHPYQTGYDIHGNNGFMKHASCVDLEEHCQGSNMSDDVRRVCPITCFECMPPGSAMAGWGNGPCYDAKNTGIRFRQGPKATCHDLVNYCNHSKIGPQVSEACKLSCGLCDIHVDGIARDQFGKCDDGETTDDPQFTIAGVIAACSDMEQYCNDHPDSYLVRHKCPSTCHMCGDEEPTTKQPMPPNEIHMAGDQPRMCDRRRRNGFCNTRRRRNI